MKKFVPTLPVAALAAVVLAAGASGTAGALAGKGSVDKDDLQKNVVTTKNVKNGSLKGADLKKDSLTGKQVKESSLGVVPKAASVETLKFFDVTVPEGQSAPLIVNGSIAALAVCDPNAADTQAFVIASTTAPGAAFAGDDESGALEPSDAETDRDFEDITDSPGGGVTTSDGYDDQFWIRAANGATIFGTVGSIVNADTNTCQYFGTYSLQ